MTLNSINHEHYLKTELEIDRLVILGYRTYTSMEHQEPAKHLLNKKLSFEFPFKNWEMVNKLLIS